MHIFIASVVDAYSICKSDYGTRCLVSITDILVIVAASKVTSLVLNRFVLIPTFILLLFFPRVHVLIDRRDANVSQLECVAASPQLIPSTSDKYPYRGLNNFFFSLFPFFFPPLSLFPPLPPLPPPIDARPIENLWDFIPSIIPAIFRNRCIYYV